MPAVLIVVVLVGIVIGLIIYNRNLSKKIETFKNINNRINNLSIVQDFMSTVGSTLTVENF